MITVIDYGMGNIRSVVKAVEKFDPDVKVSSDPASIASSKGLIMPGDGAFGAAMENLEKGGWIEPLKNYIAGGGHFLGICLGYQLLFSESEEFGHHKGLDIIKGKVVRFNLPAGMKVPHMGWNSVELKKESKFLKGVTSGSHFYFIHTYYTVPDDPSWTVGEADYGVKFACMAGKGNLLGTQFHPEKSHNVGLKIIENFVRNVCE
ncbi:MAG: imidazole glycerol phosphate synthase subunit HisH [Spirochaetota bacterium]